MTRPAPPFIFLLLGLCLLAMLLVAFNGFFPGLFPDKAQKRTADASETGWSGSPDANGQYLSELMRKIQADLGDAETLAMIGAHFITTSDFEKAEGFFAKAIAASPENIRARYMLANCFYLQGKMPDAAKAFEDLLEIRQDANAQYNLALLFKYHLGKTDEAEALLRKIVDSDDAGADTVSRAKKELER